MSDEAQIRDLLEEMLNSGRTPEQVCAEHHEHLPEVRRRWARIRGLQEDLERAFPSTGELAPFAGVQDEPDSMPRVPGYELHGVIGQGGMGVVYRARHLKLERLVALKMLRKGDHASARELAGLVAEARSIAGLTHPHIVQVHDVGEFDGLPYFTMELVEGGSLAHRLRGEPQAAMRAAEWVSALAHAMQAAHDRGVVHRDLKPGNVLITGDGTLKITDFGLARRLAGTDDTIVTIAGARFGTPSYMPPEQALGTAAAFRPAADIYSLGAILYEMLTGRPPFRGESPAETERQVISDEPVPPSRLNPRTPRDLQTICLKCLQKSPERRYSSARELGEDVDRFVRGEPIRARPVGVVERAAKWARRRPAQAALAAAALFVVVTMFAGGLWYQSVVATRRTELAFRESAARDAVANALGQAVAAISAEEWNDAERAVEHAKERREEANLDGLAERIAALDSAIRVARALEQTRQNRVTTLDGGNDPGGILEGYKALLAGAGLGSEVDPHRCAAIVRSSPIRAQLLAALDDCAGIAYDMGTSDECDRLLSIAREADPGSEWRDRFRTQAGWGDRRALLGLAGEAAKDQRGPDGPAVHQLGLLGVRLNHANAAEVGTELLQEVVRTHPDDFWMNWELGTALLGAQRFQEAVSPLRAATALRPRNAIACGLLGGVLAEAGEVEEGVLMFHRALALTPDASIIRRNFVRILSANGRWREVETELSWWRELDRWGARAHSLYAQHLLDTHRYEEALAVLRRIREQDPDDMDILGSIGIALMELGRYPEADPAFQEAARRKPENGMLRAWYSWFLFRAGRIDDAIGEQQAAVAHSVPAYILKPPLGDLLLARGRLAEACDAFEQLTRADSGSVAGWTGFTRARLGLRKVSDARASLDRAAGLTKSAEQGRELARVGELHARISELLKSNPEALDAPSPRVDAAVLRDIAEWNWRCGGKPALAVMQFQAALTGDPALAVAAGSRLRFHAASAALAAASMPASSSVATSSDDAAQLRHDALEWLLAERASLIARRDSADGPGRAAVSAEFRSWLRDPAIAMVCNARVTEPAPDPGRWQQLWTDLKRDASLDDAEGILAEARLSASKCKWPRAKECYAELFRLTPDPDGEVWFERAAVELLTSDLPAFQQTCSQILDAQAAPGTKIRPYHVARACTLAPLDTAALIRARDAGMPELLKNTSTPWAATEAAAMMIRNGQNADAIVQLKRSIAFDPRVGMAVLNWLWLAIAYDKLGSPEESRRWFERADGWLQPLGEEQPPSDGPSALHLHNWLEAQILRREAALALANRGAER